jgi:phosphatidylglycerophosphatase A
VDRLDAAVGMPGSWAWIAAGFILFRIFDIWKPWPVSWADRNVEGGLGVMSTMSSRDFTPRSCWRMMLRW